MDQNNPLDIFEIEESLLDTNWKQSGKERAVEADRKTPAVNEIKIKEDLDNNWAVVAEAIQTVLRRENYPNPYEALKDLTRGKNAIDKKSIHQFIDKLKISAALKKELKAITPYNYTGISAAY